MHERVKQGFVQSAPSFSPSKATTVFFGSSEMTKIFQIFLKYFKYVVDISKQILMIKVWLPRIFPERTCLKVV